MGRDEVRECVLLLGVRRRQVGAQPFMVAVVEGDACSHAGPWSNCGCEVGVMVINPLLDWCGADLHKGQPPGATRDIEGGSGHTS